MQTQPNFSVEMQNFLDKRMDEVNILGVKNKENSLISLVEKLISRKLTKAERGDADDIFTEMEVLYREAFYLSGFQDGISFMYFLKREDDVFSEKNNERSIFFNQKGGGN